ncbi:hypothetical protein BH11PSE11_BH11PSE11_12390 [soil metagenome]
MNMKPLALSAPETALVLVFRQLDNHTARTILSFTNSQVGAVPSRPHPKLPGYFIQEVSGKTFVCPERPFEIHMEGGAA